MTATETAALITSFIVSAMLTPLLRAAARRTGRLDIPNERSSHAIPTPRNGGVAIVAGIFTAIALSAILGTGESTGFRIAAAALLIALLSTIDERRPIPPAFRLTVQCLTAAAVLVAASLAVPSVAIPLLGTISIGAPGTLVISMLWLVGVLNGFNFMDGLNGIASQEAAICGGTMALLFARHGDHAGVVLAFAVAGAALGFLVWNIGGTIFMGDVGSAPLGLLLGALTLRLARDGTSLIAAAVPLAPFLFDTAATLIRRAYRRERLFSAHRSHFYQRLHQTGLPHLAVTGVWSCLAIVCASIALSYDSWSARTQALSLLAITLLHATMFSWIATRHNRMTGSPS
jgi:UDP-GlcNAc:undecaprenyl-phosphate GlcNAc-1-phosphate transferase